MSKVLKLNFIELATKIMLGRKVERPAKNLFDLEYVGVKASQFSFNRLQKADPVLGVDMASTGEVGCLGDDTSSALLTPMLSVGQKKPNIALPRRERHSQHARLLAQRAGRAAGIENVARAQD